MITAWRERREQARRRRVSGTARVRLMREHAFAVQPLDDEMPEARLGLQTIREARAAGSLGAFVPLYESARAADLMLANGIKLHVTLWTRLCEGLGDDGQACDAMLPPFERWWEETRTPLAAAALANALLHAAFAHRGSGFADGVRDEQWAAFNERLDRGRDVLGRSLKDGEGCTEWLWANYDYGLHDADNFDEFVSRFERVWSRDRTNVPLCKTHGFRLLPRWKGRDSRDLETFAREAATSTQDRFGDGLYALIYGEGYRIGAHEVADTEADKMLMKQGYEDLVARFPAPSLVNRYASGMYFARDYVSCAAVFRDRMRAVVPEVWLGSNRADQVDDALETFRVVS